MYRVSLQRADDAVGWRSAARELLLAAVPPEGIVWEAGVREAGAPIGDLFADTPAAGLRPTEAVKPPSDWTVFPAFPSSPSPPTRRQERRDDERRGGGRPARPHVPRAFLELAERVVCHRDPDRFALLYRVLWRLAGAEPGLLSRASDPDVHRLHRLGKAVSRERHKMHAFVRFRRTPGADPEHYGAWFEPEHHTLRLSSGFFVRRFANMRWSIATPAESAHWDGHALSFGRGGRPEGGDPADDRSGLLAEEAMASLWRTYFAHTFNPARLRIEAMRSEMPLKYWKNLPEAPLIADLVRGAGRRAQTMVEAPPTRPPRFAERATARARNAVDGGGAGTDGTDGPSRPASPPPAACLPANGAGSPDIPSVDDSIRGSIRGSGGVPFAGTASRHAVPPGTGE